MSYIDGFVVPVPKAHIAKYKDMANFAGKVWMEHGALSYVEAIADDAPYGEVTSFPRSVNQKDDETVAFSYVTYKSREHRDEVLKKVMEDPRLQPQMQDKTFDMSRMIYGGFQAFLEL